MNTEDNRRSFRVNESIYVKFNVLTEDQFTAGIRHYKVSQGPGDGANSMLVDIEARLSEAMFMLKGEHGALGRCITLLNDKLNVVIGASTALRAAKSDLTNTLPQNCDVSADGLCFASERPLAIDDKLYIQFLLSTDNRYIDTFCKVTRLTDPPGGNNTTMPYGIVIEFVDMLAAQREMLIQHMFGRESETLRMRRLELDASPPTE